MSGEDWQRVKALLYEALQVVPNERARFLEEHCPNGHPCRAELDSLLRVEAETPDNLGESPALKLMRSSGVGAIAPLAAGEVFEQRFELMTRLGEGGMGQVWLARQLTPIHRPVALKLIKTGVFDASVVQRFESERQSVALMDHPTIAKMFEAGTTSQGQPYFVMEYVPGPPITEYCDRKRLSIGARLRLVIAACEGVQHAHQKAIIHRDLKPANILVVEVDGEPAPRIIDFGIARATSIDPLRSGECTLFGQFIGTPGYMSPDQIDPAIDIDTRVDVYSLGVVLYMLLTGRQPFDSTDGAGQPLDVHLRRLREEDPAPPSTRMTGDPERVAIAQARSLDPKPLANRLRGDLDWIALKALARDRTQRYGTPSDLAADLTRYLQNEPVMAGPPTRLYRLGKYARRHRVGVAIAAGLLLLLTSFSVLQGVELRRIAQERDRANHERDRATRITDFMTQMFKVSDPGEARGNSITAREILDEASADIGTGLARDPEVQAQMLHVMAGTYLNLGLYARAHALSQRALDARKRLHGATDVGTLESATQLGWILDGEGRDAEAETLERQTAADEERILGADAEQTLVTMDRLAVIEQHEGRYESAEQLARQAMQASLRKLGSDSPIFLSLASHHAGMLWSLARYAEAEGEYHKLLDVDRRVFGPDHPQTLLVWNSLALTATSQHHVEEAERLDREVLVEEQRILGLEHEATVKTMANLASLLTETGRLPESEQLHRRVLAIRSRTLGPTHPETLNARLNLADTVMREGRVHEAERLQRGTLSMQRRALGADHPDTLNSESNLAAILIHEHRYDEAERLAGEALARQSRILGQTHPDTLGSVRYLGMALAYDHRYRQAGELMRRVADQDTGSSPGNRWIIPYTFACIAAAGGRPSDAIRHLREAIARGYGDADGLMADDDLRDLRQNADFLALVAGLRTPAEGKI